MIAPSDRLLYALTQTLRVTWFFGQYALAARLTGPAVPREKRPPGASFPDTRIVVEELRALLRRDLANIEEGHYRLPHDMVVSPGQVVADAWRFFADLPAVARRRRERIDRELPAAPAGRPPRLPRYYLRNFHFQTDGYLSARSARLYDHQVEVLFGGGADAMRRQALVPISRHLRSRRSDRARLLDVAAGTGRFLTFVKDNWPRLETVALDLSEPYLAEARQRLAPWRRAHAVQAAAEAMPFPDGHFDLVTCIYLFHEIPHPVRQRVAAEIARVLAPGGRFVLMDSIQKGDKPAFDDLLDLFPIAFHEPFYAGYLREDLERLFAQAGLVLEDVQVAYFSKTLTFRKP